LVYIASDISSFCDGNQYWLRHKQIMVFELQF